MAQMVGEKQITLNSYDAKFEIKFWPFIPYFILKTGSLDNLTDSRPKIRVISDLIGLVIIVCWPL